MRICFYCNLVEFKPKGNVLQFFIMLRALDRKLEQLTPEERQLYTFDCVLPFQFKNGMGGFSFRHVRFYKSNSPIQKMIRLDRRKKYDFLFIRGRNEAYHLLKKKKSLGKKLLYLAVQYNIKDPYIMGRLNFIFRHARIVFFQTEPNAQRYRSYQLGRGRCTSQDLDRKIQVLSQFVEHEKSPLESRNPSSPLHLIQVGVIRPRYGLAVATKAIRLIRKEYPRAKLKVLYPSIVGKYRKRAKKLLRSPGVVDHGQRSMWKTKQMIAKNGVGVALLYDKTQDQNPSHSYLSRILECMALGVPVLTTRTIGNLALLGEEYPLFAEDAYDIVNLYGQLCDPAYYAELSAYVKSRGERFLADNAVQPLWSILHRERESGA